MSIVYQRILNQLHMVHTLVRLLPAQLLSCSKERHIWNHVIPHSSHRLYQFQRCSYMFQWILVLCNLLLSLPFLKLGSTAFRLSFDPVFEEPMLLLMASGWGNALLVIFSSGLLWCKFLLFWATPWWIWFGLGYIVLPYWEIWLNSRRA